MPSSLRGIVSLKLKATRITGPADHPDFQLSISVNKEHRLLSRSSDHGTFVVLRIITHPHRKEFETKLDSFLFPDQSGPVVQQMLTELEFAPSIRDCTVRRISTLARKAAKEVPLLGLRKLAVEVQIREITGTLFDESEAASLAMRIPAWEFERRGGGLVPASASAIESLERVVVSEDGEGTCMVCLDGFNVEKTVVSMLCSHLFHRDCIARWLTVSNPCPLCRFSLE